MYTANEKRYDKMKFLRCGNSGLLLPRIALGLWHNFGTYDDFENQKNMLFTAFDNGITHFDLANNYGPEPGSAEENFGKILKNDFKAYRNEMVISTKAGYYMWPGPYGDFGSRKYLISSLDDSLKRLGLDLAWLDKQLKKQKYDNAKEIYLGLCDKNNKLTLFPVN